MGPGSAVHRQEALHRVRATRFPEAISRVPDAARHAV